MTIDYSKWEKIDEYSSDEEDNGPVRVTRLDGPSRVVFGGDSTGSSKAMDATDDRSTNGSGSTIQVFPGQVSTSLVPSSSPTSDDNASKPEAARGQREVQQRQEVSSAPQQKMHRRLEETEWIERGGLLENFTTSITSTKDLNPRNKLYWCQDRESLTLRLALAEEQTDKTGSGTNLQVVVDGMLPYLDRHCATHSSLKPRLSVSIRHSESESSKQLLEGFLPHPVRLAEDDDSVDWTIERDSDGKRFVAIKLYKAFPMAGMTIWWDCPLVGTAKLDHATIRSSSNTGSSDRFSQAWDEAHKLFLEKRKKERQEQQTQL